MKGKVLFITLLLSVLLAGRAEAQRCLPGMKGIQVSAEMADGFYSQRNRKDAGYAFSLALFTYGKGGHKWMYGIGMMKRHYPYRKTRIPLAQYTGEAGYCYNFLSTRKRRETDAGRRGCPAGKRILHLWRFRDPRSGSLPERLHRTGFPVAGTHPVGQRGRTFSYPIRNRPQIHILNPTENKKQ